MGGSVLSGLDKYQPARVLVENNTGTTIPALSAISLNGIGVTYPQIILGNPASGPIFGITTQPILSGSQGIATVVGISTNLNTSSWAANSELYSNSSGVLSTSPANYGDAPVALVIKSDPLEGILYIIALVSQYHGAYGFLDFQGTWDASTGSYPSSPQKGYYWVVSVAGTIAGHAYSIGDWITYNGTTWNYVDNSSYVTSVNGSTGPVIVNAINQLNGDISTPVASQSQSVTATINPNVVSNAKLAQMSPQTIKGNNTSSLANASDLTPSQVNAILPAFVGDSGSGGTQGLVPAPTAGQGWNSSFLSANGNFSVVDQSKPRPQPFVLYNQTPGPAVNTKYQSVTISGNYAYVAGGGSGATMSIFDISNQASPVFKSSIALLGSYGIAVQGNYAYVPSSGGFVLYVVNISNPNSPTVAGSVSIGSASGSLYSCVVSGNYCYIATQNKGLTVVDVTNPASPAQVFQEGGTTNKSFGVAISGTTVYTTNYQTSSPWTVRYLKTWNVSSPTSPSLLNTYTLPAGTKPLGINISGNTAFIQDSNTNTIQVIDITTPTAPNYLSSLTPTATFNSDFNAVVAVVSDNYVYVPSGSNATYGGAIDLFDLTNRSSPVKVATATLGVPTSVFGGIAISNGYIYVGDYGVAPGSSGTLDVFTMPFENLIAGNIVASTISGNIAYSAGTPTNWNGSAPTTVKQAIDRIAALLYTLNGNTPIP